MIAVGCRIVKPSLSTLDKGGAEAILIPRASGIGRNVIEWFSLPEAFFEGILMRGWLLMRTARMSKQEPPMGDDVEEMGIRIPIFETRGGRGALSEFRRRRERTRRERREKPRSEVEANPEAQESGGRGSIRPRKAFL
jgi:hypothetical protein